jgi:hypothetical protein
MLALSLGFVIIPLFTDHIYMSRFSVIFFAAVLLAPSLAFAKRAAPVKVEPVIYQGIRYVAPNDDGRHARIEAWDVQTDKKLWDLTIFTNRINLKLEQDAQWVFIKTLKIQDDTLYLTSESGKIYQVNLNTKVVTEIGQSNPILQPVSDHKPSYEDFVSKHNFPYVASSDRQKRFREDYSLLSVGLTKAEVLEVLGEPDYSQQGWSKTEPREYLGSHWIYFFEKPNPNLVNEDKDKRIDVFFEPYDRVDWIASNVEGLGQIGSPRK